MSELNPDLKHNDEAMKYTEHTRDKKNGCIPAPPKRGEYMYCQQCGKIMLPEDFSKNELIRKREFKWQLHYKCMLELEDLCDRSTTGLVSERQQLQNRR